MELMMVRCVALALSVLLVALSCSAEAQEKRTIPRIGYLKAGGRFTARDQAFLQGLRELGYVEGKDILIERRGDPEPNRLHDLAIELVKLKVNIIVALDPPAARAVKHVTASIPIVMRAYSDPVKEGFVANLAHPGGNITGFYSESDELLPKRLELIAEVRPRLNQVAVLQSRDFANTAEIYRELETAAKRLGLRLQPLNVQASADFEPAFRMAIRDHAEALTTIRNPLIVIERERIAKLAITDKLPAIYDDREFVEAGGLMSYGTNLQDLYKRAAAYVDKILKGRIPADLPVEQPTKFEFFVNLKTAKQIGLIIPPNVLARADKVLR